MLRDLVGEEHLPPAARDGLRRFQFDLATFKVDWALDGEVPWLAEPTRSPAGTHTVWAYTTLPQRVRGDARNELSGRWGAGEAEAFAARLEARVEALAPGFTDRIIGRHILTPEALHARNASLVGGQRNGGTAQLYQQLVFRPMPGLGRPETPVRGLYLGSSSAHPGGGVHGGPGAIAARAALHAHRARRVVAGAGALAAGYAAFGGRRKGGSHGDG